MGKKTEFPAKIMVVVVGDLHAREIARMSLTIIEAVKVFKIEHRWVKSAANGHYGI